MGRCSALNIWIDTVGNNHWRSIWQTTKVYQFFCIFYEYLELTDLLIHTKKAKETFHLNSSPSLLE